MLNPAELLFVKLISRSIFFLVAWALKDREGFLTIGRRSAAAGGRLFTHSIFVVDILYR